MNTALPDIYAYNDFRKFIADYQKSVFNDDPTFTKSRMASELGLPNSRQHETEADRIGVELAARAGYDPRAAITLWQKMGKVAGDEPPKFLSTHPPRADRVKDLTVYSAKVMPLYQQSAK